MLDGSRMSDFPRRRGAYYYYQNRKYVSVTNVLKAIAKPGLIQWAARAAADAVLNDPFTIDTASKAANAMYGVRDSAAARGNSAHSYSEAYASCLKVGADPPPPNSNYDVAIQSFFESFNPEVMFTEANVYSSTHRYAGTADLIAEAAVAITFGASSRWFR